MHARAGRYIALYTATLYFSVFPDTPAAEAEHLIFIVGGPTTPIFIVYDSHDVLQHRMVILYGIIILDWVNGRTGNRTFLS